MKRAAQWAKVDFIWIRTPINQDTSVLSLIRPYEVLTSVRLEPVEKFMCFDKALLSVAEGRSTNGSNIKKPNQ